MCDWHHLVKDALLITALNDVITNRWLGDVIYVSSLIDDVNIILNFNRDTKYELSKQRRVVKTTYRLTSASLLITTYVCSARYID